MTDLTFTYSKLGTFGALGNQLWEIAATIGIANKLKAQSRFPKWEYQPYFSVPEDLFTDNLPLECDLSGNYLQDHKYFDHIYFPLQQMFSPSEMSERRLNELFPENMMPYTAVHVRRANNLSLPDHHPVQTVEYYEQALEKLENPRKLIVFSDDIPWCKQQSIFAGADFGLENQIDDVYQLTGAAPVSLDTVALDLLAMTKCRQFVISNSTFSWWSAYLSDATEVIYPTNWYGPAVAADYTLMIGKDWGWTGI